MFICPIGFDWGTCCILSRQLLNYARLSFVSTHLDTPDTRKVETLALQSITILNAQSWMHFPDRYSGTPPHHPGQDVQLKCPLTVGRSATAIKINGKRETYGHIGGILYGPLRSQMEKLSRTGDDFTDLGARSSAFFQIINTRHSMCISNSLQLDPT